MVINNREEFEDVLPAGYDGEMDYEWITMAIGRRNIKPMDIDAGIEIGGYRVYFESKADGVNVSPAQRQALETPEKSRVVVYMWPKRNPQKFIVVYSDGKRVKMNREKIERLLHKWADAADEDRLPNLIKVRRCEICGAAVEISLCERCYVANKGWENA